MASDQENDPWRVWWDARQTAFEKILGPADDQVLHAVIPLQLGGSADVLRFRPVGMGVTYVTSDLIGDDSQVQNDLGNYELMICLRSDDDWAPNLISRLASYTFEACLNSWETMDIGTALPEGSTIAAFAYVPYARSTVRERNCGLLLWLGITSDELQACHSLGSEFVVQRLKAEGVFPFTDLARKSVLTVTS